MVMTYVKGIIELMMHAAKEGIVALTTGFSVSKAEFRGHQSDL